ncbi:MAG: alanine dehydrogenase, partial [Gammaproteobacteria bacterium]|nr:alanine dehydrogenase [Gammaproteobacteria bacterium]
MLIGVPTETKQNEYRVGLTPASVRELARHGHEVVVESGAGNGIGCADEDYFAAGAKVVDGPEEVFGRAEMVVKVKEPQPPEVALLREGQLLFTYLHLAPARELTEGLLASGCTAIAYETITDDHGGLPLLAPMSEVAGRMAPQVGAYALEASNGGRGLLLGGVPGVEPARVVVIGGGVVGTNAARIALGMGADVVVLDKSLRRITYLDDVFGPRLKTHYATFDAIEELALNADMVIGAVLIPGASAPKLINRGLLAEMRNGAVLVDVSIDQGGCFETSRPTTHTEPTFVVDGVVHYCVANMPGAVPRTSTFALNHATLPFIIAIAEHGWRDACRVDRHLRAGLNVH